MANEGPSSQHDVAMVHQPLAPPFFGLRIVRRRRGPANYRWKRSRTLILRQQQNMRLEKIFLHRQVEQNASVGSAIHRFADRRAPDVAEPFPIFSIRANL